MAEFANVDLLMKHVKGEADTFVKKVVLDLDRSLVRRSPVDTGRFKGNWQLGVDNAPGGDVEMFNKSPLGTPQRGVSDKTIATHLPLIPKKAAGHVYYLVNNLPYAEALENGHSQQAPGPHAIVGLTVLKFESILKNAAKHK